MVAVPAAPTPRPTSQPLRSWALEAAAYVALFGYASWFRLHGIEQAFLLREDQIRDWSVATRDFAQLPLSGVTSMAGGTTAGPMFYWILWAIAKTLGPVFDNLPHAGGIGLALLQSYADVFLAWALARRTTSVPLALAIVLLSATSVFDASLSSTIWNPIPAESLAKVALALVLVGRSDSLVHTMSVVAIAWSAAQTHTTAIVVAAPLIAWVTVGATWREPKRAVLNVLAAGVVMLVLQVPWLIHAASAGVPGPSRLAHSISLALESPAQNLRIGASAAAVVGELGNLLLSPLDGGGFPLALAAGVVALLVWVRDVRLLACGVLPVVSAIAIYSLWQGAYERYWMMPLGPSAAICLLAWIAAVPGRWRDRIGLVALAVVMALQPARFEQVRQTHAFPGYGALVKGCRTIAADDRPLGQLRVGFPVAAGNPLWLCSILGVGLTPGGDWTATIDDTGDVQFTQVPSR